MQQPTLKSSHVERADDIITIQTTHANAEGEFAMTTHLYTETGDCVFDEASERLNDALSESDALAVRMQISEIADQYVA